VIRSTQTALCRVAAIILLGAACSGDPSSPEPLNPTPDDTSQTVNFLDASSAPPIANPVVTFYAVSGEDREANMYYRPRPGGGGNDSSEFVRFRVQKDALLSRPDGTPFAAGDSILITITLADPQRLIVDFQPAGLRFSPANPAKLKLSFREADDDLNRDGEIDGDDATVLSLLSIWQRETSTSPWIRLESVLSPATHEVETSVGGFTGYIIAW
jgi:hypothetical protein